MDIVYQNDLVVMSVFEADAKAENSTIDKIAKRNLSQIKSAISYQNENYSQLPKRIGYTTLLVVTLSVIIFWLARCKG